MYHTEDRCAFRRRWSFRLRWSYTGQDGG